MFVGTKKSDDIISKVFTLPKTLYLKTLPNELDFYPCYLKFCSKDLSHKAKLGGVVYINNDSSYKKMLKSLKYNMIKMNAEYIQVQEEIRGYEFIVGIRNDKTFGKLLMFGLGGSNLELHHDASFAKIPLSRDEIKDLINSIRNNAILNKSQIDILSEHLYKIQKLSPSLSELDINPLILSENKFYAIDNKIYK